MKEFENKNLTSPMLGPELVQLRFLVLFFVKKLSEILRRMLFTWTGDGYVAIDGRCWMLPSLAIQLDYVVNCTEIGVNGSADGVSTAGTLWYWMRFLGVSIRLSSGPFNFSVSLFTRPGRFQNTARSAKRLSDVQLTLLDGFWTPNSQFSVSTREF